MDRIDCVVIGAGVVGLACARSLAQAGLEVVIAEREASFGTGVSARSSEVVHSGLYYPPGSLKARLCVRGRHLLQDFCGARHVGHRRCGKLVVATRAKDETALRVILERGRACGVDDLQWLSARQARALEPELACAAALWSPSSGIVDSHGLMTALLADAEAAGAVLALGSSIRSASRVGQAWQLCVAVPGEPDAALEARWLINAAGLDAQAVAATMKGFPATAIAPQHLAKGHYFSLAVRAPFSRLIYPMPTDGGLGVHLTLDLAGQARFGPDVEWLPSGPDGTVALDYAVDPARAAGFYAEVRRYWPGLPDGALMPAYSGIRPKLSGPAAPVADFCIIGPAQHGCPGVVQLFGVESPGLTASMAIGEAVAVMVA